jgi:small ligand-binding sensory domain FIST
VIRIGSAISTHRDPGLAAAEVLEAANEPLGDAPAHLAFVFASRHPADGMAEIMAALGPSLDGATIVGCTTQTAIGGGREVEDAPAVALWLAHLPGATLTPFELTLERTADGPAIVGFPMIEESTKAAFLLADPYTFPTQGFLHSLNQDYPELPVLGGQASGAGAGEVRLVLGKRTLPQGAVGLLLGGNVRVRTVVSQGCKPIGSPYIVTEVRQNVVFELAGKPPLVRLREILSKLPPEDRARAAQNLQIGVVIDERKVNPRPGDFVIRPVLQADPETGAMAVGEVLDVGQTIQFQIRDAATADADLRSMLEDHLAENGADGTGGALLFTCNGRGLNLFGTPDHDVSAIRDAIPNLPVAGMFCGGEIGPIGGVNFLHGFTASVALLEEGGEGEYEPG